MKDRLEFFNLTQRLISRQIQNTRKSSESKFGFHSRYCIPINLIIILIKVRKLTARTPLGFFGRKSRVVPKVIVFSLTKEQISSALPADNLVSFFRESRFENPEGDLLIESKSFSIHPLKHHAIVSSASLHLMFNFSRNKQIEILGKFETAIENYKGMVDGSWFINLKLIYTLFEAAFWFALRQEEITVITTQSSMQRLPVPFLIENSSFRRKMLWFSTNSEPFARIGEEEVRSNLPGELDSHVDMHYVWDSNSKSFLMRNGINRVKSVGSILFTDAREVNIDFDAITFVYFDVTPFENPDTYYTVERMCLNLTKLVSGVQDFSKKYQVEVKLIVKPKRSYTRLHSKEYINLLTEFAKADWITIFPSDVNLYGLARKAHGILGIPYTSPVVMGKELNVPSAFIDLHKDEYILPAMHNGLEIISTTSSLEKWFKDNYDLFLLSVN